MWSLQILSQIVTRFTLTLDIGLCFVMYSLGEEEIRLLLIY